MDIEFKFDYDVFSNHGSGLTGNPNDTSNPNSTSRVNHAGRLEGADNVKDANKSAKLSKELQLLLAELAKGKNHDNLANLMLLIRVDLNLNPDELRYRNLRNWVLS